MKSFEYKPHNICPNLITFDIDDNKVRNVKFNGGCNGNTTGISMLVEGMSLDEVEEKLKGIPCGNRQTSCPDQLARAIKHIKENAEKC